MSVFVKGEPNNVKPLDYDTANARKWDISAPQQANESNNNNSSSSRKKKKNKNSIVYVSACITMHHEDDVGLDAGVASFELSDLPFESRHLQLVYIIDGRRTRTGRMDSMQERSTRFLLARLCGMKGPEATAAAESSSSTQQGKVRVDGEGLVYVDSKRISSPHLLRDGTAMYKGSLHASSGRIPFVVLYKDMNGGKRHSHQMFFELTAAGLLEKPRDSVMFVDSDVMFAWPRRRDSFARLYAGLVSRPRIGGACGEIEVWKWTKNPVTLMQYFEYKSNQFLAKTFESFFGMVTCLPGAFCMIRPQALECVLNRYLAEANSIFEKNKLDLVITSQTPHIHTYTHTYNYYWTCFVRVKTER